MFEPKRLHPIAALINFLKQLKELIVPFVVFIVFGSKGTEWDFLFFIVSFLVLLLILGIGILSWLRFTYRIEDGELRLEYGIVIRKKRYIPFDRIQSLDFSEGILHRPFGLVKVKVETAGSSGIRTQDAEAVLTAIKKEEAESIEEILASFKKTGKESTEGQEDIHPQVREDLIYKISSIELLLLASTSGGVGVVISAVFAFFIQFDEFIPYEEVFKGVENFISNGIIFVSIIVFVGFLLAWIIALIGTMLKYANFTVRKVDNDLIITRGLLEKRQLTIPLHRIQAVRISENLVRQPIGYASVFLESAGGSAVNAESSRVLLLPIIKKGRISGILQPYLKEYELQENFVPAPKRALKRYVLRGWLYTIPFIVVPILVFKTLGLFSLSLLLVSALWSYINFKDAGWKVNSQQLNLRYRTMIKHSVFMKKNKLQSITLKDSYFQRQQKLASIQATVKSGSGGAGGTVVDLDEADSLQIYKWYSNSEM